MRKNAAREQGGEFLGTVLAPWWESEEKYSKRTGRRMKLNGKINLQN